MVYGYAGLARVPRRCRDIIVHGLDGDGDDEVGTLGTAFSIESSWMRKN